MMYFQYSSVYGHVRLLSSENSIKQLYLQYLASQEILPKNINLNLTDTDCLKSFASHLIHKVFFQKGKNSS